ncbi:hypothetical protein ABVT39_019758 [Epinephelus coioides]
MSPRRERKLQESLHAQKEETEKVREFWMKESDKMKATFETELKKKEETEKVREFWMKESDKIKATFETKLKKVKSKRSAQNANLKNQVAILQRMFGRELHVAQQNISNLEKALEATKSDQDECKKREETLQESRHAQKEETEKVRDFWMKESDKIKATFETCRMREMGRHGYIVERVLTE